MNSSSQDTRTADSRAPYERPVLERHGDAVERTRGSFFFRDDEVYWFYYKKLSEPEQEA